MAKSASCGESVTDGSGILEGLPMAMQSLGIEDEDLFLSPLPSPP